MSNPATKDKRDALAIWLKTNRGQINADLDRDDTFALTMMLAHSLVSRDPDNELGLDEAIKLTKLYCDWAMLPYPEVG